MIGHLRSSRAASSVDTALKSHREQCICGCEKLLMHIYYAVLIKPFFRNTAKCLIAFVLSGENRCHFFMLVIAW